MARDACELLDRKDSLGGHALLAVQPVGDRGLTDSKTVSQFRLASGPGDGCAQCLGRRHKHPFTTLGNMHASTQSDIESPQTARVPKDAKTSPLWQRFLDSVTDLPEMKSIRQEDIARIAGVGQTAVSSWKTGQKRPDLEKALALAAYARMCVQYLYTGEGPQRPWGNVETDFAMIVQSWEHLDDGNRAKLLEYAELLMTGQREKRRPRWQVPVGVSSKSYKKTTN